MHLPKRRIDRIPDNGLARIRHLLGAAQMNRYGRN
jgi:hypothetical protein